MIQQTATYRLIGRPESGYSLKVRSAMRLKNVPFEWLDRFKNNALFKQHATVPLIPLVLLPDGSPMQDSTPILEHLESQFPEPTLHPEDAALHFLSELMEEYGDEWANKLMFHYRWGYVADQKRRGASLGQGMIEGFGLKWLAPIATPIVSRLIVKRMIPRMGFAGANDNNAPLLVESFAKLAEQLQTHLQNRPYLFGARPAFGDFGLWGQLYQAWIDASCQRILNERAPAVVEWIQRMENPSVEGDFESLQALAPTLLPIYAADIGPRFLAWSAANAQALQAGDARTELQMNGEPYYQKTFKYPASGLQRLRQHYATVAEHTELRDFLSQSDCLQYLEG